MNDAVKIVSDGTLNGTTVTVNGEPLYPSAIRWTLDANDKLATAIIELPFVQVEVVGEQTGTPKPLQILSSECDAVRDFLAQHRSVE